MGRPEPNTRVGPFFFAIDADAPAGIDEKRVGTGALACPAGRSPAAFCIWLVLGGRGARLAQHLRQLLGIRNWRLARET